MSDKLTEDMELFHEYIVPQTIKDNTVLDNLLRLYFDSTSSIDYKNPLDLLNINYLVDNIESTTKNTIRKELLSIHLQEIYNTLGDIGNQEDVYEKFKEIYAVLGLSTQDFNIASNIENEINSEYIAAARSFKTKKGNKTGFFFVYDLINKAGIQSFSAEDHFKLIEGTATNPEEPYVYRVETSLYKEIYDVTVVPLAHPLGFDYYFSRVLYLILEDNYNYIDKVNLLALTIGCFTDTANSKILTTRNLLDGTYGEYKSINVAKKDGNEKVTVDFYPIKDFSINQDDKGIRVVKEYNNNITFYTRQDRIIMEEGDFIGEEVLLEISDVQLLNSNSGVLYNYYEDKLIFGESNRIVNQVSFKEYTIIDAGTLKLKFKINGGDDTWLISTIDLDNKTISTDKKFFNKIYIDRKTILDNCLDYNGRIIESKGDGCQWDYTVEYTYELAVGDISNKARALESNVDIENRVENESIPSVEDVWARKQDFTDYGFYIGSYIVDPNKDLLLNEPFIGGKDSLGNEYTLGYNNSIRNPEWIESDFSLEQSIIDQNINVPIYEYSGGVGTIVGTYEENSEYIAWETFSSKVFGSFLNEKNYELVITYPKLDSFDIGDNLEFYNNLEGIFDRTYLNSDVGELNLIGKSYHLEEFNGDVVNISSTKENTIFNLTDSLNDTIESWNESESSTTNDSYFKGLDINIFYPNIGDFYIGADDEFYNNLDDILSGLYIIEVDSTLNLIGKSYIVKQGESDNVNISSTEENLTFKKYVNGELQ